ncbi:MAG TPA: cytochrome c, partial [Acidobacteriaceae bacterium]|nr:cytochrome c [Acidobacteriaceae bacterium]
AAAGQIQYQQHGCFACHGQAGEGGRAPALAPLIAKASDAQVAQLLQTPNAKMKAGGMPPFSGTPEERSNLIAYLRTLRAPQPGQSQAQTQQPTEEATTAVQGGSVPYPDMAPFAATTPISATPSAPAAPAPASATLPSPGRTLFLSQGCAACHGPTAQGTHFAPSLIGIAKKFPGDKLPTLLHHPTARMRSGGMPIVNLKDAQLQQLVAYLSSLEPAPAGQPNSQLNAQANHGPATGAPSASMTASAAQPAPAPVPLSPLALRGQQIFQHNRCETCHGVGGLTGTVAAPPLAGTASLLPEDVLESLLRHHTTRMQMGGMPLTNLKEADMKALVTYIRSMPTPAETK